MKASLKRAQAGLAQDKDSALWSARRRLALRRLASVKKELAARGVARRPPRKSAKGASRPRR